MSLINSGVSSLDASSGFGLHRAFSASSENLQTSGANSATNSPLHLATMLNSLSMGPSSSSQGSTSGRPTQTSYLLKVKNVPQDISLREAHAVFALALDVNGIDIAKDSLIQDEPVAVIIAKFDSLTTASQYAAILDSKTDIFGPAFLYKPNVELIDEITQQQIPFQQRHASEPTQSHQQHSPQHQHLSSQPEQQPLHGTQRGSSQVQIPPIQTDQTPHSQSQTQLEQQDAFTSSMVSPPQSASSIKRPGLLGQRSRFSFSDPFSSDQPQQQTPQQNSQDMISTPLKSQDAGKSFLLMENDEINESIWGSNGGIPSSMSGLAFASQPQTPSLEWGTTGRRQGSFFSSMNPATVSTNDITSMQLASQLPPNLSAGLPQHSSLPYSLVGHVAPPNTNATDGTVTQQHLPGSQPQGHASLQSVPGQQSQSSSASSGPQKVGTRRTSTSKSTSGTILSQKTPTSGPVSSTGGISQLDLSLLARVPPPANPADQNPPCNTLYVGNLPPDATEQELRQLFSGQKGFRRLSFRNKNTNGNGHGPMCFVEFEDVAHATRALAELYGRQLPRTGTNHNNKGGIRLSFSKNPLGVRGPNSRRSGNNGTVSNGNYSYATAFGKSS
ncbi:LAMI_0F14026g1_1 [Lachancea mirantina]|uniref:LAMI_0F14026g1_1 n=1 Tax=Lachancea mirantina TaxID=1230905 RepID=A0A1G4K3N5_9SACH|nr:LAMI_0F14026g1_1 [Lachancea mirantina]